MIAAKTHLDRYLESERMVWYLFRNYHMRFVPEKFHEDLVQEGRLGLWRACLTFKEELGWKFSTYAWRCISTALQDYRKRLEREGRIQVSHKIHDLIHDGHQPEDYRQPVSVGEIGDFEQRLECLSQIEKAAVIGHYSKIEQGLTASVFKVTKQAVSQAKQRGLARLSNDR